MYRHPHALSVASVTCPKYETRTADCILRKVFLRTHVAVVARRGAGQPNGVQKFLIAGASRRERLATRQLARDVAGRGGDGG